MKVIHFYFTDWCATYDLDSLGVYLDTQTIKLSNAETEYLLKMRKEERKKLETYVTKIYTNLPTLDNTLRDILSFIKKVPLVRKLKLI